MENQIPISMFPAYNNFPPSVSIQPNSYPEATFKED